jgi:RNA polymerase sigma factor (TIGR02999 family)
LELVEVVYEELRRLAKARMAREYDPQTLQTTALVHEVWLRLGADEQPKWANRGQFFSAAAEAMRRILVERARRRKALRHGGGQKRVDLDALNWESVDQGTVESTDDIVIELHEALEKLAINDPDIAELVKLHYFAGLKIPEIVDTLGLSNRTAKRHLAYARAWLKREIEGNTSL